MACKFERAKGKRKSFNEFFVQSLDDFVLHAETDFLCRRVNLIGIERHHEWTGRRAGDDGAVETLTAEESCTDGVGVARHRIRDEQKVLRSQRSLQLVEAVVVVAGAVGTGRVVEAEEGGDESVDWEIRSRFPLV